MPQRVPLGGVDDGRNVPRRLVHAYDDVVNAGAYDAGSVYRSRGGGGFHFVAARRQVLVSKPVGLSFSDRQMGGVLGFADALQIQMRLSSRVNGHVDARGLFERERVANRVSHLTAIVDDEVGGAAARPSPYVGARDRAGDAPYRLKRDFAVGRGAYPLHRRDGYRERERVGGGRRRQLPDFGDVIPRVQETAYARARTYAAVIVEVENPGSVGRLSQRDNRIRARTRCVERHERPLGEREGV